MEGCVDLSVGYRAYIPRWFTCLKSSIQVGFTNRLVDPTESRINDLSITSPTSSPFHCQALKWNDSTIQW